MHDIKAKNILAIKWTEGKIPDRLESVEITYNTGERVKYEGADLDWVVPQIKDSNPSCRPNLLSDTK